MLINYTEADGRVVDLEVTEVVGQFYLTSLDQERKTERRETRRHTLLSTFTYEDKDYFDSGVDICGEIALADAVSRAMYKLTARERYLLTAIHYEGRSYTEIARSENKVPSTILRETQKAADKFKRLYVAVSKMFTDFQNPRKMRPLPWPIAKALNKQPSERRSRNGTHAQDRLGEISAERRPGTG